MFSLVGCLYNVYMILFTESQIINMLLINKEAFQSELKVQCIKVFTVQVYGSSLEP